MMLPHYNLLISEDDETGVEYVALVDSPAIKKGWKAFAEVQKFFADKDRRIISGPLMISDLPIYRKDEKMGEYYVSFDRENIQKAVEKFFRNGLVKKVNMMHQQMAGADGVYMIESMLIDKSRGIITPVGFDELPDGSWFGSFKVDNIAIWEEFIKTGRFTGFSVEGIFEPKKDKDPDEELLAQVENEILS